MKRICLVYCYMGVWPDYLKLFLESCRYNSSVDFLIFTNCGEPKEYPENVKIIPLSLKEFNELASLKLGMEINIKSPYKLCDFKPCYGFLFEEHLKAYDFFGYGDIDVIFGNIRKHITDDLLNNYDIITSGLGFLFGHFTLMKNSDKMRKLFQSSVDIRTIVSNEKHFAFDECHSFSAEGGHDTIMYLLNGGYIFDCNTEIESLTHIAQRLYDKNELKVYSQHLFRDASGIGDGPSVAEGLNDFTYTYKWEKGKITCIENKEEFMYLHLYNLKHRQILNNISHWKKFPDSYLISEGGIFLNGLPGKETKNNILFNYYKKYFPRTTAILSTLIPNIKEEVCTIDVPEQITYREHYLQFFLSKLDKFPFSIQETILEIFELESSKLDLQNPISSFGHFRHHLPKKRHLLGLKKPESGIEYILHEDTRLIETKWNWQSELLNKDQAKHIDLQKGQFFVIIAPVYFRVIERSLSKSIFKLLQNFNEPSTLENAINLFKESEGIKTSALESELLEFELTEQLNELILSGILLKATESNAKNSIPRYSPGAELLNIRERETDNFNDEK